MATTSIAPPGTKAASVSGFRLSRLLELWHLLSLDAPTVAVVWAWAFAHSVHTRLTADIAGMLAIATWLLYVADRLLDGFGPTSFQQDRHRFHARHRRAFVTAALPAGILLAWLLISRLDPVSRADNMLLAIAAALYLLGVHVPPSQHMRLFACAFPKEMAVAIIFAIGCIIPAWSSEPHAHLWLSLAAPLFAGLCWLNCVAIENWEAEAWKADTGLTLPPMTAAIGKHLHLSCLVLVTGALVSAAAALAGGKTSQAAFTVSIAVSSISLILLDRSRMRLMPLHLRAAADAVLLTPLLIVPSFSLLSHIR